MRILEIILDNRLGGISQRALTVAYGMERREVETHLVLPKEPGGVHITATELGIPVHQITMPRPNPRRPIRSLFWLIMIPVNTWQIWSVVRTEGIDAIHVNGLMNLPGFFAAKLCRVPLIWHLAGTTVYPRWLVRLLRPALKRATVLICIAEKVRDYFLGEDHEGYNYRIIYEPVDEAKFTDTEAEARPHASSIRKQLGIDEDAFLVTTVANVSPVKGILYAVRAFQCLATTDGTIHYLVVGEILASQERYTSEVRREIECHHLEGRVTFAGRRSDIADILRESDLFLLPSLSEGTPISILEAMCMYVPVVASNVGGIAEQIQDGVTGLLVRPKSTQDIVAAITRIIADPTFARTVAQNANAIVRQKFSLTRYLDEFDTLLADLVDKGHI